MSRRVRTAARIGAFAALALLLTGCIKLDMNLVINSDDTVSGAIQLGVQKELLELTGQSVDDLLGTDTPFPSDVPGVTVEPFDDGEFAGQQFTFESVPLTEFAGTGAEEINITRSGDTYVITGVLDLSSGLSGATGFTGFGATGAELFESAQIEIAFTFPGDVIDANGQIDGNTVTYVPAFGERLEINATGSAIDDGDAAGAVGGDDGGSNLVLILIIALVVVATVIVIVLVMRSRKGGGGGTAAPGFGDSPATAPVAGGPAPEVPAGGAPPPMPPAAPPPPPEA
jgi:hypothetical protein